MGRARTIAGGLVTLSLAFATGCNVAGDPSGEEVGEADLAQSDVGYLSGRVYTFEFDNEEVLATMIGFNVNVGSYRADTEYWFVDTDSLQYLGSERLTVSHYDFGEEGPPSPSGDQQFTQPVYLTWNGMSTDPVSGGSLYRSGNHWLRLDHDTDALTRITWYQVLPSPASPANITPDGSFLVSTDPVYIPSGYAPFYIDATIE